MTGHLTRAGWVHHSWRFGHAENSMKWVPRCLNADQKRQQCQSSKQLLEFFWHDPNDLLSRFVTMDKTWLYHYNPEKKQQSIEWWHSGSPHPKKFQVQKSAGKVLASIFWDQDGILLIDYLPKGQNINAEYYSSLLDVLITHPILQIWPHRTTTCSLDWKNSWKVAIFHPTRRSLLPWRPGWTDNLLNFIWVACKSWSNELRSVLNFVGSMLNKSRI